MNKPLTVDDVDTLVSSNDKMWWETYAKTVVSFRPGRGGGILFRTDAYYNREWRGKQKWGTIKRIEISDDGLFRL